MTNTLVDFKNIIKGICRYNESLGVHTSFGIGGQAGVWLEPKNLEDLKNILTEIKARRLSWEVIGNGSNLLVGEKGLPDVVIKLSGFNKLNRKENILSVGSGVGLGQLVNFAALNYLKGLEFLAGIPGTVGGAIKKNAGAWGGNIADVLKEIKVMGINSKVYDIPGEELSFQYRSSNIGSDIVILEASFNLVPDREEKGKNLIADYLIRRKAAFPGEPNAGCIFKNPINRKAGEIIDKLGLKGFRIGEAEVSKQHANIIINRGNAKASDVLALVRYIQEKVYRRLGIKLELEIDYWGSN